MSKAFNLQDHGIAVAEIYRNLPPSMLYEHAIRYEKDDPVFGFDVVTECPNVPADILIPRNPWADKEAFDATAKKLAGLFIKNFAAYEGGVSAELKAGGPAATV